jgi:D-tyrosyl-tRNA(Tyr) deacylase
MRLVIQRVRYGAVTVGDAVVGKIGQGLVVLLGFHKDDDTSKFDQAINRLLKLRLWDSKHGPVDLAKRTKNWDSNLMENDFEVLLISQFTLYAVLNGNKPDFHNAKKADEAKILFDEFVGRVRKAYQPERVQTGAFGEYMDIQLANDGPVTLTLDF